MLSKPMTVTETADYLRLSENYTYRLLERGRIPGFKVGGGWRVNVAVLNEWMVDGVMRMDLLRRWYGRKGKKDPAWKNFVVKGVR